ncbi:MAG: hypothetical protein KME57_29765 [Scytonema hyalinum WJT4-NPBG1]|jgi:transposase|nr:hypothetical protein [Scytonema hyalinum WJT4-NPBG1]
MEKKRPACVEQIPLVDWEKTPASVQKLVEGMGQQIESLEKQLTEVLTVQEQLLTQVAGYLSSSASQSEINAIANANLAVAQSATVTQS